MIQTILAATDGSAHADKAVSIAGDLSRTHAATIVLLHAVPDIVHHGIPKHHQQLAEAERLQIGDVLVSIGEQILRQAELLVRAQGAERIEITMPSGHPVRAILDHAQTKRVDLIVMGSRGLSNFQGLMLGSVSHQVSHLAPCSCMTVR